MRLALFDLDNTLVDRTEAITRWAQEFATARSLGPDAIGRLIKTDDDGGHRRDDRRQVLPPP